MSQNSPIPISPDFSRIMEGLPLELVQEIFGYMLWILSKYPKLNSVTLLIDAISFITKVPNLSVELAEVINIQINNINQTRKFRLKLEYSEYKVLFKLIHCLGGLSSLKIHNFALDLKVYKELFSKLIDFSHPSEIVITGWIKIPNTEQHWFKYITSIETPDYKSVTIDKLNWFPQLKSIKIAYFADSPFIENDIRLFMISKICSKVPQVILRLYIHTENLFNKHFKNFLSTHRHSLFFESNKYRCAIDSHFIQSYSFGNSKTISFLGDVDLLDLSIFPKLKHTKRVELFLTSDAKKCQFTNSSITSLNINCIQGTIWNCDFSQLTRLQTLELGGDLIVPGQTLLSIPSSLKSLTIDGPIALDNDTPINYYTIPESLEFLRCPALFLNYFNFTTCRNLKRIDLMLTHEFETLTTGIEKVLDLSGLPSSLEVVYISYDFDELNEGTIPLDTKLVLSDTFDSLKIIVDSVTYNCVVTNSNIDISSYIPFDYKHGAVNCIHITYTNPSLNLSIFTRFNFVFFRNTCQSNISVHRDPNSRWKYPVSVFNNDHPEWLYAGNGKHFKEFLRSYTRKLILNEAYHSYHIHGFLPEFNEAGQGLAHNEEETDVEMGVADDTIIDNTDDHEVGVFSELLEYMDQANIVDINELRNGRAEDVEMNDD